MNAEISPYHCASFSVLMKMRRKRCGILRNHGQVPGTVSRRAFVIFTASHLILRVHFHVYLSFGYPQGYPLFCMHVNENRKCMISEDSLKMLKNNGFAMFVRFR